MRARKRESGGTPRRSRSAPRLGVRRVLRKPPRGSRRRPSPSPPRRARCARRSRRAGGRRGRRPRYRETSEPAFIRSIFVSTPTVRLPCGSYSSEPRAGRPPGPSARAHHQDDRALLLDVPADHPLDLRLDVARLPWSVSVIVRPGRSTRRGWHCGEDPRKIGSCDTPFCAPARRRLRSIAARICASCGAVGSGTAAQSSRRRPHADVAAKLGAHRRRVGRVDELQRAGARAHLLAEREDVRHDPLSSDDLPLDCVLTTTTRHPGCRILPCAAGVPRCPGALAMRSTSEPPPIGRSVPPRATPPRAPAPRPPRRPPTAPPRGSPRPDRRPPTEPTSTRRRAPATLSWRLRERRHRGRPLEICAESGGRLADGQSGSVRGSSQRAALHTATKGSSELTATRVHGRRSPRIGCSRSSHWRPSPTFAWSRALSFRHGEPGAALKELGHKVFHAEDSFENSARGRPLLPPNRRRGGWRGD